MKYQISNIKSPISNSEELIKIILENRGVKTKKEIKEFLDPKLENVTIGSIGIDKKQLKKAIARIKSAIKKKEQIVVFGDYDVDGICGTAILWETLRLSANWRIAQGKPYDNVFPYIPHRIDEGYGLSIKGIQNVQDKYKNVKLIITVDNGIVANSAVDFANEQGIDVIITDHHVLSKIKPKALAIVHTTKLCGTGVAWILSREIKNRYSGSSTKIKRDSGVVAYAPPQNDTERESHLELVALATVADLVPLKAANRTLLKFGMEVLRRTKRVGLLELFKEAAIDPKNIGTYEIGHIIAPRLNAMGRLEYAMDSLRLICTKNQKRAEDLARILGSTNKERQTMTLESSLHAIAYIKNQKSPLRQGFAGQAKLKKLLFISHETYEQGVIGLIAGKLVEEFYRPAIVVSIGEKFSKASARSVRGFNIIEFIRGSSELLVDAGGHPMAAGFTVETAKLLDLQKALEDRAELLLEEEMLTRTLKIDLELPLELVDLKLYQAIQKLSPFGMGNYEPAFVSRGVLIDDMRTVGRDNKHLKLRVKGQGEREKIIEAIGFGMGDIASKIHVGDKIDIAYVIDENIWNGNKTLQLKIRDVMAY